MKQDSRIESGTQFRVESLLRVMGRPRSRADVAGVRRDNDQLSEDLALLTVLLAAAGFLLTVAQVMNPTGLALLALAVPVATWSWLASETPVGHDTSPAG